LKLLIFSLLISANQHTFHRRQFIGVITGKIPQYRQTSPTSQAKLDLYTCTCTSYDYERQQIFQRRSAQE